MGVPAREAPPRLPGWGFSSRFGKMSGMETRTFDDPALRAAMRAFLDAEAALAAATDDAEVLSRSDAKSVAGLAVRKRLLELGWSAPVVQRSRM